MANEIAKTNTAAIIRPSFIPQGDTRGTEHITKDDLQMPRLALAQPLTPQVVEGRDGFAIGTLFNSLTEQVYGKGPLEFTVVRADAPRYVEFVPREQGGGIKDFDVPPGDPRTEFTRDETGKSVPPVATKFYDFVILLLPQREPIALSFKSTGLKVARQLNALIKMRNAPIFAGKYVLGTAVQKNAKGTFAIYTVQNAGWVNEEDYAAAGQLYEAIKDRTLVVDREEHAEEGDTSFDTSTM